jgi:hypothetical protein
MANEWEKTETDTKGTGNIMGKETTQKKPEHEHV